MSKKAIILTITSIITLVVLLLFSVKACAEPKQPEAPQVDPYFDVFLPQRGEEAASYVKRKGLNEKYCLLVDYALPSGEPRVFLWSFAQKKVIYQAHTMHGPGKGSTPQKAVLSNVLGSKCSAPGPFAITKEHGTLNSTGYFLRGLDANNSNARSRGLMIHGAYFVDLALENNCEYIPLDEMWCAGCVTISTDEMFYLGKIIASEEKQILLWSFCSDMTEE